jgi:hypothetical protein
MNCLGIRELWRPLAGFSLCLLVSSPTLGADWTPTHGELGQNDRRVAIGIGASYGVLSGSEVEKVDPGPGLEVGVAVRALWSLSAVGSFAVNSSDVSGQLIQLIDQNVRTDGRSGNVQGSMRVGRLRAGLRFDALREQNWRFHPYLTVAVVYSRTEVNIDSVDGVSPPPEVTGPPPEFLPVNLKSFTDTQLGGLGRFGVEWAFHPRMALDLSGSYEVIEFPSGTNAITSINTLFVFRVG